ncbi:hypothetical protein [Streptomyces asiaticus]
MIQARDEEDRLTDTELIDMVVGLLLAGFEAITTQIPNCVLCLTRGDRALWNRLRANPAELPGLRALLTRGPELTVRDITWKERPHVRGPEAMRVTWQGGPE